MTHPNNHSTAVCVLGMHRSGTSVVTRLLNYLSVDLGEQDQLMSAGEDNPRGYWEHEGIVAINEEILAAFGDDWSHPPVWPDRWQDDARLDGIGRKARRLIEKDFGERSIWGWKDPRTCLTVPLWRRWVPNCRFIFCVRHPADVAGSLVRRDRFTTARALWLWTWYNLQALRGAEGADGCVVRYESTLKDPLQTFDRLGEFLDRGALLADEELRRQVRTFVDPDLQHHSHAQIPGGHPAMRRAGELLESAWKQFEDPLPRTSGPVIELLDEAASLLKPLIDGEDAAAERWFATRRRAERQLAAALPGDTRLVLVDEGRWIEEHRFAGREAVPLTEESGRYAGPPLDDQAAIDELERVRAEGASHLAIAEPAFWWLDHYGGFRDYLGRRYRRILKDDSVVVFDLAAPLACSTTRRESEPKTLDIAFVVGCARSGTSILGELIASHPEVRYLFEAHDAWSLAGSGPDGSDRLVADDVSPEDQQRIRRWFAQHHRDESLLVEKNPRSALRIPMIRSIFPEARLIHIVRDGRDVACSMVPGCGGNRWSHLRPPGWRQMMQQYAGAFRCAHAWLKTMQFLLDDLADTPHLLVRYEDLVADSPAKASEIFEYLQAPVTAEVDAFCERISDRTDGSYHAQHQSDWFRPDHEVRVGRWRQNLTDAEAETINDLLTPMLRRLGYEP